MKLYQDSIVGEVSIRTNARSRGISVRVKQDATISVTVPPWLPKRTLIQFLHNNSEQILRKQQLQRESAPDSVQYEQTIVELRVSARQYLPSRLMELAAVHGFKPNGIRVKHNHSNWGSCSSKGNINLNINLMRLPTELSDYVMLHELCHLKFLNHGPEFHALLESVCPGHREYGRELKKWQII